MADRQLVKFFLDEPSKWVQWRNSNPGVSVDFTEADFSGRKLHASFFVGCNLYRANLRGAELHRSKFMGAYCHEADFSGAFLPGANFLEANLQLARFDDCDLTGAVLVDTTLTDTCFRGANLSNARLEKARLIGTDFRHAILNGAKVYGISAWDVKLEGAEQTDLRIARDLGAIQPEIITDNLELAQFLYLLINNAKLRNVIETITSKVVLILGRFMEPHKSTLNELRSLLRERGYLPVLFDFSKPSSRDTTETVSLLAHMARFLIADISAPRSVPHELAWIVPRLMSVPVLPILQEGEAPYGMFTDIQRYPNVLPIHRYEEPLDGSLLDDIIRSIE